MKKAGSKVRAKILEFFRKPGVRVAIHRDTLSRMLEIAFPTLDLALEALERSGHLEKVPHYDQWRPTRSFDFGEAVKAKAKRAAERLVRRADAAKVAYAAKVATPIIVAERLARAEKNAAIREAAKAEAARRAAEIEADRKTYVSETQLRVRAKRDARLAEAARKRAIKDAKIAARAEEAEAKKLRAAEWAAKRAAEIAARPVRVGARGPKPLSTEPNAFVKAKRAELARLAASAPLVIFRGTPKPSAPYVDPWKIIRARIAAKPPLLPSDIKPDLVKAMRRRA